MNKIIHVFMVGLIVYFTYHAFVGDRGLLSLFKLEDAIQSKEKELDKLVLERQELESKVTLLNPKQFDQDFLDELARKNLGFIGQNEVLIILKKDAGVKDKELSNEKRNRK